MRTPVMPSEHPGQCLNLEHWLDLRLARFCGLLNKRDQKMVQSQKISVPSRGGSNKTI